MQVGLDRVFSADIRGALQRLLQDSPHSLEPNIVTSETPAAPVVPGSDVILWITLLPLLCPSSLKVEGQRLSGWGVATP